MIPIRLLPILLTSVPATQEPPQPAKPNPLPDERDGMCSGSCYMYADGCPGACEMLRSRLSREARAVTPDVAAAVEAAQAERMRAASRREEERQQRAADARLAATPDKTLRRRAGRGDPGARRELERRASDSSQ